MSCSMVHRPAALRDLGLPITAPGDSVQRDKRCNCGAVTCMCNRTMLAAMIMPRAPRHVPRMPMHEICADRLCVLTALHRTALSSLSPAAFEPANTRWASRH